MPDINVELTNNIQNQVRINVLYNVLNELCYAFNFPGYISEVLKKGIVDKQILSSVYAAYKDRSGRVVGLIKCSIDWKKYSVYTATLDGREIAINENKSLIEQFAEWSTTLASHIKTMQQELGVSQIDVYIRYIEEISNNPSARDEANAFLGFERCTDKLEYDDEKNSIFQHSITCVSKMLPELTIEIQNI